MYVHVSDKPIGSLYVVPQKNYATDKPSGLWIARDMDWEDWQKQEGYAHNVADPWRYELCGPMDRILRITTVGEMRVFDAQYGQVGMYDCRVINWAGVASEWDGIWIEALPRNAMYWYVTWDLASGCVWNPRGMYLKPLEVA